jgi:hypothetical protein
MLVAPVVEAARRCQALFVCPVAIEQHHVLRAWSLPACGPIWGRVAASDGGKTDFNGEPAIGSVGDLDRAALQSYRAIC